MSKQAVIWDLDGVIVDTEKAHFKAWVRLFHELGRSLSYEEFLPTFGRKNADILQGLLGRDVPPSEMMPLWEKKESYFREEAHGLRPFSGVKRLLSCAQTEGYLQAIGSSAPLENIVLLLDKLGFLDYFASIVSAEDILRGKPDPEVFLLAARRLGVAPGQCVVIEDAVAGIQAAKAAGMAAIAVTNSRSRQELAQGDLVVASVAEVGVDVLERLLASTQSDGTIGVAAVGSRQRLPGWEQDTPFGRRS